MGTCAATRKPLVEIGIASEFYWACRNGNYSKVSTMLHQLTYEEVNRIEPNGSTALHAATCYNHPAIVKLLLDSGCARTILNRYGNTAYGEAKTDEMRELFNRSNSIRFIDEHLTDSFALLATSGDNTDMKNGIPDDWFKGYTSIHEARESQFMAAVAKAPLMMKKVLQNRTETETQEALQDLIDTNVEETHCYHNRVKDLFRRFKSLRRIDSLLTMYTLETPIYGALQGSVDSFATLLYLHLSELRERAYQGYAYRGGKMTHTDVAAYRWALKRNGHVIETRTVQSMSKRKDIAQTFAKNTTESKPLSVLLIFDFPTPCETAIDLTKISENLPLLSEFEREEEVTLLPFTLFEVQDIKIDAQSGQYRITLKNVPVPDKSLFTAWHHVKT